MKKKYIVSLSIIAAISLSTACGDDRNIQVSVTTDTPLETEAAMVTEMITSTMETETKTVERKTETVPITETKTQSETEIQEEKDTDRETQEFIFTVTPINAVMYTQKGCNVREKPSTDYGIIGYLDKATEVKVTGKVNEVNWYEVSINGDKGYISNSLLADTKPNEIQEASPSEDTRIPPRDTDNPTPPAATPPQDTDNPIPPATTTLWEMYGFTPNGDGTYTAPNGNQCGINSDGDMIPINPDTGKPFEKGEKSRSGLIVGPYTPGL